MRRLADELERLVRLRFPDAVQPHFLAHFVYETARIALQHLAENPPPS